MNKKASMQLGINAIVILIIALAILGLAMGFITNLFQGGQKKLGSLIDRTDLPVHADAANQIVFDTNDLKIKQGDTGKLVVSVYNSRFGDNEVFLEMPQCVDEIGAPVTSIDLGAPGQKIPRGMDAGYKAIITIDNGGDTPAGTYICTIKSTDGNDEVSKQVFINVFT